MMLGCQTRHQESWVWLTAVPQSFNDSGQLVHTHPCYQTI